MQTAKSRSSLVSPTSKQSPKWGRGMNFSLDLLDSKAPKILDRKHSSLAEKRNGRALDTQEQLVQLQEELKKAKEELEELKRNKDMPKSGENGSVNLEKEVHVARESERKMLESLISQTKQFEQTKISLEEAKLEIRSLQESIKSLEGATHRSSRNIEKSHSDRNLGMHSNPFGVFRARDEIGIVQKELKLAAAAEEKSKKAMDGLALALKEVATEANQVKARLSTSQTELEKAKSEAQKSKSLLKVSEEKLQVAEEECKKLKLEIEDRVATLTEKEKVFMDCMKISEEEIEQLKQENSKLIDSLRVSREDNVKLRDILKHAMNEATVMKETLEIARNENSRLQDLLSEKEIALQSIRQEYDCLKVSEKAAIDSVKELKGFLAATSYIDDYSIEPLVTEAKEIKRTVELPSDQWGGESRKPHGRRHSLEGSRNLIGDGKSQVIGSISNISDSRIPSSIYTYDSEGLIFDDLEHKDRTNLNGVKLEGESERQKKKKTVFKRFGDMLRRRSFHKQSSSLA